MTSRKPGILLRPNAPEKCQSCGAKLPNWPRCHNPHMGGRVCLDCYRLNLREPRQGKLL